MKTTILGLLAAAIIAALTSCATTETTITAPDGTVTVIKSTAPDANAMNAGVTGAALAVQVINAK